MICVSESPLIIIRAFVFMCPGKCANIEILICHDKCYTNYLNLETDNALLSKIYIPDLWNMICSPNGLRSLYIHKSRIFVIACLDS